MHKRVCIRSTVLRISACAWGVPWMSFTPRTHLPVEGITNVSIIRDEPPRFLDGMAVDDRFKAEGASIELGRPKSVFLYEPTDLGKSPVVVVPGPLEYNGAIVSADFPTDSLDIGEKTVKHLKVISHLFTYAVFSSIDPLNLTPPHTRDGNHEETVGDAHGT